MVSNLDSIDRQKTVGQVLNLLKVLAFASHLEQKPGIDFKIAFDRISDLVVDRQLVIEKAFPHSSNQYCLYTKKGNTI